MKKKISSNVMNAWIQLYRAQRLLLEKVEAALKQHGLPPLDWYDILLELKREKEDGLRQFEIGEKVLLSKHSLSRLIDRLEAKGLVLRCLCEEDGRGNRVVITDKGITMQEKMWPVYSQAMQENFATKLNAGEFVELSRLLEKV